MLKTMMAAPATVALAGWLSVSPAFAADTVSASPNPCTPSGSRYCQSTVTWSATTSYPYYAIWVLSPLVIDGSSRKLDYPGAIWACGPNATGTFVATLLTNSAANIVLTGSNSTCVDQRISNVNPLARTYVYSN